jgi:hypothetical protein
MTARSRLRAGRAAALVLAIGAGAIGPGPMGLTAPEGPATAQRPAEAAGEPAATTGCSRCDARHARLRETRTILSQASK